MNMFVSQSKAEVVRIFRNPYFIFWSLFMPIVFYFIYTRMFNLDVPDQKVWKAHFLMSMTAFSVMGSSIMNYGIRLVQERTQGWTKFLQVTPLRTGVYFSAKMIAQSVVNIFSIVLIFFIGAMANGVNLTAGEWFLAGSWIFLGSLPFLALGSLVGTMKKVETASGVSNFIYLILAILGGLWMPMEILPKFLQNLGDWLPAYHYGNGAWEIVRGNLPEHRSIIILSAYLVVFMVLSVYIRKKQQVV